MGFAQCMMQIISFRATTLNCHFHLVFSLSSSCLSSLLPLKCSKILFTFCFKENVDDQGPGIHKMLVRKANREDPDQTSLIGSALFVRVGLYRWQLVFQVLEYTVF